MLGTKSGPEVINFFMLNWAKHEILNAHKYKNTKKSTFFRLGIYDPLMLFFLLKLLKWRAQLGILQPRSQSVQLQLPKDLRIWSPWVRSKAILWLRIHIHIQPFISKLFVWLLSYTMSNWGSHDSIRYILLVSYGPVSLAYSCSSIRSSLLQNSVLDKWINYIFCPFFINGRQILRLPVWFLRQRRLFKFGNLSTKRICSQRKQILFFKRRSSQKGKNLLIEGKPFLLD